MTTTRQDMKIFIVDDDIFCLALYKQFLKNLGYNDVTSFMGGDECLGYLEARPNLVFLDYNMEGLNGIEVLKVIKEFSPSTIVYIITGKEDQLVAKEAMKEGALDYIIKSSLSPDSIKTLMNRAENIYVEQPKEPKLSFFKKIKTTWGF